MLVVRVGAARIVSAVISCLSSPLLLLPSFHCFQLVPRLNPFRQDIGLSKLVDCFGSLQVLSRLVPKTPGYTSMVRLGVEDNAMCSSG
jgi:hypothetical protein